MEIVLHSHEGSGSLDLEKLWFNVSDIILSFSLF